jgi:serine protease AprX
MPQYKPSSPSSFATNRDYLLSLLPIVDKIKIIDSTSKKAGALLYNVPNPFEQKTEIYYSLNRICRAKIVIIDINGREVYSFDDNIQSAGVHKILFNRLDIKSGIYVYSLLINGTFIHSKRMIIL